MTGFLRPSLLLACSLLVSAPVAAASGPSLATVAERSGFRDTGRYDEVIALCDAYQARWPESVRCEEFGRTPQGRPMKLLVASRSGALDPAAARSQGIPVVLVQGGIHAGEIDGKDAGFLALRVACAPMPPSPPIPLPAWTSSTVGTPPGMSASACTRCSAPTSCCLRQPRSTAAGCSR